MKGWRLYLGMRRSKRTHGNLTYIDDVRSGVIQRLPVLEGLEKLNCAFLDEVFDTRVVCGLLQRRRGCAFRIGKPSDVGVAIFSFFLSRQRLLSKNRTSRVTALAS